MTIQINKERRAVARINPQMCVSCGICRRVCPTESVNEFQRDICRLCPDCAPDKPEMLADESK
ncbi:MAG: 4Fe-4S binding protein, partial [Treponema sp.]|nr:4Fe-4S binding protein [Treponema sp.]